MGNCGGSFRYPCLSESDARYNSDTDFSIKSQNGHWKKATGLSESEGSSYFADGTLMEELLISATGLPAFNVSYQNYKIFTNFTVDGTRAYRSVIVVYKGVDYGPTAGQGWAWAFSSYSTSTFELDGRILTSPSKFALAGNRSVWNKDDTWSPNYVVSNDTTYGVSTGARNDTLALLSSCVNSNCDKSTEVFQYFVQDELYSFEVQRGKRIVSEDEFITRIESSMEEFNVPAYIQSNALPIMSNPHAPPEESLWCQTDPACSTNPYVNPTTAVRTGPLVGLIVAAVVLVVMSVYLLVKRDRRTQMNRSKLVFANRIAQTISVRAHPDQLSSDDLKKEFERIDESGDGFIQKKELWDFLSSGKAGSINKSDFEALWNAMDLDESGDVNFLEYCAFMANCHDEYDSARNNSKVISARASQMISSSIASKINSEKIGY